MAAITTYSTLVSAVVDLAEDDSTEFRLYIPTAIGLAEDRLVRETDTLGVTLTATATAAAGNMEVAKPSGWRANQDLYIDTSSGRQLLAHKTKSWLIDYWPVSASTGVPVYYAEQSNTTVMVAPTPASTYTCNFTYTGKPDALTSASPTNYWTDFCPDCLFHATMVEMARFMRNDSLAAQEEQAYQNAIQTLVNEGRRQRRDNSLTPTNKEGGLNTLIEGST